jgi:hypothetical protein
MWSADEMDDLCQALRAETEDREDVPRQEADDELMDRIEAEIAEYREWLAKRRAAEPIEEALVPPEELRERLWLIGWMIYEMTWQLLNVTRRTEGGPGINEDPGGKIRRLTELVAVLPWPHFAPRALGAIRADALVQSKRDTPLGYDEAFLRHKEARDRLALYQQSHGEAPGRELEKLGLREIFLQLVLAETGTACRTAERIMGRWCDELEAEDPQWDADDEDHWVQVNFQRLYAGIEIGEEAINTAAAIETEHGFADRPDRRRLALRTAFRNPGIMTARAALHLIPLSYEMEELGLRPPGDYATWAEMRADTIRRFRKAYAAIEKPVVDENGKTTPLTLDHKRSVVQLRLNAALVLPGLDVPSTLDFADCLDRGKLDEQAVEQLSAWLAETDERGRTHGNANLIGSATMPAYLRGVEASRAEHGATGDGYRQWRKDWFVLDRYSAKGEEKRRRIVWEALDQR